MPGIRGSQAVVLLTLVIAAVNICLGVVVAVELGFGPPTLRDAWKMLLWAAGPRAAAPPDLPPEELNALLQEADSSDLGNLFEEDTLEDLFREAFEDEEESQQAEVTEPEEATELGESEGPEIWDLDEKYVETSILRLNVAMMKSGARATEIDTRLRAIQGHTDSETIQSCLASLKEDCQTYLKEQSAAAEKLHNRLGELGELASLGEEIEFANMEQAAQIETSISNLDTMDFQSDLEAANVRLLGELAHLRLARHRLRDSQDEAFLAVARYENRMEKIEPKLYNDPLTGLYNRIGSEATLHQWWKAGRTKSRQMSAAFLDLDDFGTVNDKYGMLVADKILCHVARLLEQALETGDLTGRFAGQRFLFVPVDVGPRAAIKKVELLRQKLERITFVSEGHEVNVTMCCAITEIKPEDDSIVAVEQRLQLAMLEAKKAGANRSYFHDGRVATPVESPNLGADYVEIKI